MAMAFPARTLTGQSQSAFTKLRLAASRAATPPVAPWPSPGLSIGQSCTPLSGNKCWEVIGPALGMSVGILRAVKELLDPHAEYLHEKEPKPCFIAFGMYMIGRDEHKANPTLLISCERKSPRQKAVKLVRESPILKENAGVRLAESPRPPLCSVSPIPLGPSNDENNNSPHRVSAGENLYLAPKEFTCGIPIYTKMVQSHNASYPPRGTVGGIVCIKDDLFGISTAHGFAEDHKELALPDDEMSFEILFDDWIESDGTSQEVEHTHDQVILLRTDRSANEVSTLAKDVAEQTQIQEMVKDDTEEQPRKFKQAVYHPAPRWFSRNPKIPFGNLHLSSFTDEDIGLDWALVTLDYPLPVTFNTISIRIGFKRRTIQIKQINDEGPINRAVLAVTGMSGILCGIMSQSPIFTMMPYGKSFQEMWTITLDGAIHQGDSGSWVIDSVTGNLYGQIVAGSPGQSVAYIVPAKHIAQDVKERTGRDLSLPQSKPVPLSNAELRSKDLLTFDNQPWPSAAKVRISGIDLGRANVLEKVFGSRPGDIITLVKFAKRLYKECRDAGGEFLVLKPKLRELRITLQRFEKEVDEADSVLNRARGMYAKYIAPVIQDCDYTLRQLDDLLLNHWSFTRNEGDSSPLLIKFRLLTEKTELWSLEVDLAEQSKKISATLDTYEKGKQEAKRLLDEKRVEEEKKRTKEKEAREAEYKKQIEHFLRKSGMPDRYIDATFKLEEDRGSDLGRPTYTRFSRTYLSLDTLKEFQIDYMLDMDPNWIIVKRWVPAYEQDFLWNHTRELRERRNKTSLGFTGQLKRNMTTFPESTKVPSLQGYFSNAKRSIPSKQESMDSTLRPQATRDNRMPRASPFPVRPNTPL